MNDRTNALKTMLALLVLAVVTRSAEAVQERKSPPHGQKIAGAALKAGQVVKWKDGADVFVENVRRKNGRIKVWYRDAFDFDGNKHGPKVEKIDATDEFEASSGGVNWGNATRARNVRKGMWLNLGDDYKAKVELVTRANGQTTITYVHPVSRVYQAEVVANDRLIFLPKRDRALRRERTTGATTQ
jgi:hypothetical protein